LPFWSSAVDTEILMRGAQLCSNLYGRYMFSHLTGILYRSAPKPSETHRAIASLAHSQQVPGRGLRPGWESLIIYNFDNLNGFLTAMSNKIQERLYPSGF
jgi:hypothetical protein